MKERVLLIRPKSFVLLLWSFSLFSFPLFSIFGRSLQLTTIRHFSSADLNLVLALLMGGLVLVFCLLLFKSGGSQYLWHLLWVGALTFLLYDSLPFVEKIHVALFGLFGVLSQYLFRQRSAVLACISVSFLDELLQHFLASRVGDWRDVWLNLFSASLGMLLAFILLEKSEGKAVESSEI